MLEAGKYTTTLFNEYPVTDDPNNSAWDILFNGAPSNFDGNKTYIYHLFHFIHTCVYIDNNPAKTVAAILIQLSTIPLLIFAFLSYKRINLQTGPDYDGLKDRSKLVWAYLTIASGYFFLVLVNSPIQDPELFDSPRAQLEFIGHYIPYAMFQFATIVMAMEQVNFLCARNTMPFEWITIGMVIVYFRITVALYIVYCAYIFSHIAGYPIWDSDIVTNPIGFWATQLIMIAFDSATMFIPAICAFTDAKRSTATVRIEFSM